MSKIQFTFIMSKIQFTRIDNDVNGNPRYVCHFLNIPLTEEERGNVKERYRIAVKKANSIGGRKYHTKNYGGGIVFQSYNLKSLEEAILSL